MSQVSDVASHPALDGGLPDNSLATDRLKSTCFSFPESFFYLLFLEEVKPQPLASNILNSSPLKMSNDLIFVSFTIFFLGDNIQMVVVFSN